MDIGRALDESGLVMVKTRSNVQAEMPPEPEFKPAKRERRPPPADLNAPMQVVETVKKDANPA